MIKLVILGIICLTCLSGYGQSCKETYGSAHGLLVICRPPNSHPLQPVNTEAFSIVITDQRSGQDKALIVLDEVQTDKSLSEAATELVSSVTRGLAKPVAIERVRFATATGVDGIQIFWDEPMLESTASSKQRTRVYYLFQSKPNSLVTLGGTFPSGDVATFGDVMALAKSATIKH